VGESVTESVRRLEFSLEQPRRGFAHCPAVRGGGVGAVGRRRDGREPVVVTVVFSVYLTEHVGSGPPGSSTPASWLGQALGVTHQV